MSLNDAINEDIDFIKRKFNIAFDGTKKGMKPLTVKEPLKDKDFKKMDAWYRKVFNDHIKKQSDGFQSVIGLTQHMTDLNELKRRIENRYDTANKSMGITKKFKPMTDLISGQIENVENKIIQSIKTMSGPANLKDMPGGVVLYDAQSCLAQLEALNQEELSAANIQKFQAISKFFLNLKTKTTADLTNYLKIAQSSADMARKKIKGMSPSDFNFKILNIHGIEIDAFKTQAKKSSAELEMNSQNAPPSVTQTTTQKSTQKIERGWESKRTQQTMATQGYGSTLGESVGPEKYAEDPFDYVNALRDYNTNALTSENIEYFYAASQSFLRLNTDIRNAWYGYQHELETALSKSEAILAKTLDMPDGASEESIKAFNNALKQTIALAEKKIPLLSVQPSPGPKTPSAPMATQEFKGKSGHPTLAKPSSHGMFAPSAPPGTMINAPSAPPPTLEGPLHPLPDQRKPKK